MDQRGFTLVELAVAVGITAVVAMLAVPSFFKMVPHMALRNESSEISTLLVRSRMRSLGEALYFKMSFDLSDDSYQIDRGEVVTDPGTGNKVIQWSVDHPAVKVSKRVDLLADTSDALVQPFSGDTVIFRPDGTADTAGFEAVYLRNHPFTGERYRVKVLGTTGKIGIERWAGGSWEKAL